MSPLLRAFTALCYSADGQSVLAGGMSKFVCIYHVKEQILRKKFEISRNLSLDAMEVSGCPGLGCPPHVLAPRGPGGGSRRVCACLGPRPLPRDSGRGRPRFPEDVRLRGQTPHVCRPRGG